MISAVHVAPRHRVPAAIGQRLRAIPHQLSALENPPDKRMRLEFLEGLVRIELRIRVFERHNHPERHPVVAHAVHPPAAVHIGTEWPAHRVRHKSCLDPSRLHFPQLLDPDPVHLGVQAVEPQPVDHFFRQGPVGAFRQYRHLCSHFISGREVVFGLAVLVHALVFGQDSGDPVALVNQLLPCKLCEKVYALFLDQPAEPFHDLVQRHDVVAVVRERRRRDRKFPRADSLRK